MNMAAAMTTGLRDRPGSRPGASGSNIGRPARLTPEFPDKH